MVVEGGTLCADAPSGGVGGRPADGFPLSPNPIRLSAAGLLAAGAVYPMVPHPDVVCPLRRATGIPCPFCGMTTGVVETVHGDLAAAFAASPGGIALVVGAVVALISPRTPDLRIRPLLAVAAVATLWLYQLVRFAVL